jgi:hypothetical protein
LFKSKWAYQEGEIKQTDGQYERNFLFWCEKLAGLTDEQWARGFERVEFSVREAARQGNEAWPPSYAAFLGYCDEPDKPDDPHKKALHQFVTPYWKVKQLEDQTKKERAKETAETELGKLKSLFED